MKGIAFLSVIPMRNEPSDKSEMINQILFGETFVIIEKHEKWSRVKLHHDKYEGWIDNKQWKLINYKSSKINKNIVVKSLFLITKNIIYPLGSLVNFEVRQNKKNILQTAKMFLETPYLWGGRTCMGIDCSGFIQIIFRVHGINLLRDAYQQETKGKKIKFANAATNDLAFFRNDIGKVIHVGIIFKERNKINIIHASGRVRIDKLDEKGIFNQETQSYSHNLHSIKRIY